MNILGQTVRQGDIIIYDDVIYYVTRTAVKLQGRAVQTVISRTGDITRYRIYVSDHVSTLKRSQNAIILTEHNFANVDMFKDIRLKGEEYNDFC